MASNSLNYFAGNIGIGTTNPTQKLSVNGTIQAKEVIVQTGWSDYVFAKGYRLAPLAEIERHIEIDGQEKQSNALVRAIANLKNENTTLKNRLVELETSLNQ